MSKTSTSVVKLFAGSGFFLAGVGLVTALITHDVISLIAAIFNLTMGFLQLSRLEMRSDETAPANES